MKVSIVCLVLMAAIVLVAARPDESSYTSKFDNINVDEILHSERLLNNYFKCLMDEGRCTAEGNELKRTYIIKSYLFYKKGRETKEKKEKIVFNKICIRSLINFEIS